MALFGSKEKSGGGMIAWQLAYALQIPKREHATERTSYVNHWRLYSLALALPVVVEPSPRFIQKGTPIVPAIRGFYPLILPKPIQGKSRAPSLKALEATLPSPVIISPKMFSLVPNLQTQEGVVICMLKPFLYQDSHRVPWKYDITLISTRTRKEEVYFNISSGLVGLTRN